MAHPHPSAAWLDLAAAGATDAVAARVMGCRPRTAVLRLEEARAVLAQRRTDCDPDAGPRPTRPRFSDRCLDSRWTRMMEELLKFGSTRAPRYALSPSYTVVARSR